MAFVGDRKVYYFAKETGEKLATYELKSVVGFPKSKHIPIELATFLIEELMGEKIKFTKTHKGKSNHWDDIVIKIIGASDSCDGEKKEE